MKNWGGTATARPRRFPHVNAALMLTLPPHIIFNENYLLASPYIV
jgi:hypothetical protein